MSQIQEQKISICWWLNQPIWKIRSSTWIISPIFGMKTEKYLKPPPSHLLMVNLDFQEFSIQVNYPTNFPIDSPVGRLLLRLPAMHEVAEDGREQMHLGWVPVGLICWFGYPPEISHRYHERPYLKPFRYIPFPNHQLGCLGCLPSQWQMSCFRLESPTKHVVILLVTMTGEGW